jgi:hypothetical protein
MPWPKPATTITSLGRGVVEYIGEHQQAVGSAVKPPSASNASATAVGAMPADLRNRLANTAHRGRENEVRDVTCGDTGLGASCRFTAEPPILT